MAEMKRSRLAVPLVFVLVIIAVVAIVTGFTFGPVEALCVALAGVIWLFIQNLFSGLSLSELWRKRTTSIDCWPSRCWRPALK